MLLARVWGAQAVDEPDYVKTYIYRLRTKLEDEPTQPRYLLTERGEGYWMPRPTKATVEKKQPQSRA
jgi:two-component system KDP operon response regulator KdpE